MQLETRNTCLFVAAGEHLYVWGVASQPGQGTPFHSNFERYSFLDNQWELLDSNAPLAVSGAKGVSVDHCFYVIGGLKENSSDRVCSLQCYDTIKNEWMELAPMELARYIHIAYLLRFTFTLYCIYLLPTVYVS